MKNSENKRELPILNGSWVSLLLVGVVLIIFYKTIDKLPSVFAALGSFITVLSPIFLGVVIALLLYKPSFKLERVFLKAKSEFLLKSARGFSVLLCYVLLFIMLGVILYLIIPKIIVSALNFLESLPDYYNSFLNFLEEKAGQDGKIFGISIEKITDVFDIERLSSYFDFSALKRYAGGMVKVAGIIVDVFLSVVISVYLLLGREDIIRVCGQLMRLIMPQKITLVTRKVIFRSCKVFYNFLYSQIIDGAIVAALCTVSFSLAGTPYAVLLGVLMGICNLVPYFGALTGGIITVFITLISTGDLIKAVIALVIVLAVQQLDSNIIQPKLVSNSVGLKPIYVLISIIIGSGLFGFAGIILAVPVVAVIRIFILEYANKKETLKE